MPRIRIDVPSDYVFESDHPRMRAVELSSKSYTEAAIARALGRTPTTIHRWLQCSVSDLVQSKRAPRQPRLSNDQLRRLNDLLRFESVPNEVRSKQQIADIIMREFGVLYHPNTIPAVLSRIGSLLLDDTGSLFFDSPQITLYRGDAAHVLGLLPTTSVDCIVTSPPYYGQRDYGVATQIGLEQHPQQYIDRLLQVFEAAWRILKPSGSLWVNLGDTYWSGKGRPHGPDLKQKHRRFLRPQDITGPRPLCTPKQLLLIPHRFAIAMQDAGWIVRNDNVWHKLNPTPDPVRDRSAAAHEYMFHFVKQRHYHYDFDAVAVPTQEGNDTKPPPSVWSMKNTPTFKKHIAVFPEELVRVPIVATLPPGGVLLDPFCGSGTALGYALHLGADRRAIGIDVSLLALEEARTLLTHLPQYLAPQVLD